MNIDNIDKNNDAYKCRETCISTLDLRVHRENHTEQSIKQIELVIKSSENESAQDKNDFECKQSLKVVESKIAMKTYKKIHSGEKSFYCQTCKKGFAESSDLKKHERIHTGERPYECQKCFKDFRTSSDFFRHQRIHNEKPFHCHLCRRNFHDEITLQEHVKIHAGEKIHQCKELGELST